MRNIFLILAVIYVFSVKSSLLGPKSLAGDAFRGGSAIEPVMARKAAIVSVFGFNRDHIDLQTRLLADIVPDTTVSIVQINSTRVLIPSSHVVVGLVSKYSLRDLEHTTLPFVQSFIDEVVRRKTASKLVLLIESDEKTVAVRSLVEDLGAMIANAVSDDGAEAASLLDVEVVLLSTTHGEKYTKALKKARDSIVFSVQSSKMQPHKESSWKVLQTSGAKISLSAIESSATAECSGLEASFVSEVKAQVGAIMEDHSGNITETLQSLNAALNNALTTHANANSRVLKQFAASKSLQAAEVRARLGLITALSPLFTLLAEDVSSQAQERFNFISERVRLTPEYPQRVREVANQIVGNTTDDLNQLQAAFLSLTLKYQDGSLLGSVLNQDAAGASDSAGSSSSGVVKGATRWSLFRRSSSSTTTATAAAARKVPAAFRPVLASALTSFSLLPHTRPLAASLSAQCKELVATALYEGKYNPYVRSSRGLRGWLPPLRLGLHFCGAPSLWPGALYDRLHYEAPLGRQQQQRYANRALPLHLPGVASVPFDPREAPESAEEPHSRRTDWWMDALPQWARYRVLRSQAEFK